MIALLLPAVTNGSIEAGIAAGVDALIDARYTLAIATVNEEVPLTPAERQQNATMEKLAAAGFDTDATDGKPTIPAKMLPDATARLLGFANKAAIPGTALVPAPIVPRTQTVVSPGLTVGTANCPFRCPVTRKVWYSCIALITSLGWYTTTSALVKVLTPAQSLAATAGITQDAFDKMGLLTDIQVASIVAALKLHWYQTNHHVGQTTGKITGYLHKVIRSMALDEGADMGELYHALWAIGKYVSTIDVLRALGIKGLAERDQAVERSASVILISAAADVVLRLTSAPAGTARTLTFVALMERASKSPWSILLPPVVDYREIMDAAEKIRADPVRYHIGAHFLTNQERLIPYVIDDDTMANFAAFIYATAERSSLAAAKVLPPLDEVKGSVVYQSIKHAQAQVTDFATDKVIKVLIGRFGVQTGADAGGFARAVGLITEQQVADAVAAAEAAEAAAQARANAAAPSVVAAQPRT